MLRRTFNTMRSMSNKFPVSPKTKVYWNRYRSARSNARARLYWRIIMNSNQRHHSLWASDFKHRYLKQTGKDFQGIIPSSPSPGMYQGFDNPYCLLHHPKPQRQSRHLPVIAMTPRVAYEHAQEKRIDFGKIIRRDRRRVQQLKTYQFWAWYTKLQRVRGRWCREQEISSRGVYGPAVDAAELWG